MQLHTYHYSIIHIRYDQTLFEDERKNRMMETKELFEWVLKQPCFEVSFSCLLEDNAWFRILNYTISTCISLYSWIFFVTCICITSFGFKKKQINQTS